MTPTSLNPFRRFAAGWLMLSAIAGTPFLSGSASAQVLTPQARVAFEKRMALPENASLKKTIDQARLSPEQREAVEFLYAYLPDADLADYSFDFYLRNIDAALKARREMPWGKTVGDREWRHFVLPVRVNNESLDLSRSAFYEELKPRLQGLSMEEAILEINHWLHEKATYKPSDARTSSPLSTVSQAIGRCGEESTFGVAAFRAMGIPARQVYTPRWAHTDDNHAWVEVWADGKWHFLGACEPEPVLDLAWFNAPASRGMLMNTNVFGEYDGPEEVLAQQPLSTRINVTRNYAPVDYARAVVRNADGTPAAGADVRFCIYNYAEYYPVAQRVADAEGKAGVLAGKGDMLVWATDGDRFGFSEYQPGSGETVVVLDKDGSYSGVTDFDLTPPKGGGLIPNVTAGQRAINNRRFAQEDSIRNAYTSTFATRGQAAAIAESLGLDSVALADVLVESRGNHAAIVEMLRQLDTSRRAMALRLLKNVSEKDRRDIPMDVVGDGIAHAPEPVFDMSDGFYDRYVLNPRVENEALTPYKGYLSVALQEIADEVDGDPAALALWTAGNITLSDQPSSGLRMSPASVWRLRNTDRLSRDIFYVAAARSLGIPARIDPVTGKTQYAMSEDEWSDVDLVQIGGPMKKRRVKGGALQLEFSPEGFNVDPKYYSSFSISRIDGGVPRQLEYPEDATWSSTFSSAVPLDAGQYVLTTGQRLADGGVLAKSRVFTVAPGDTVRIPLEIRRNPDALSVIGSLNAEDIYHDLKLNEDRSLLATAGRGYYVVGLIDPGSEPSAHTLNDIAAVAKHLDAVGRKIILLFPDEDAASRFDASHFKGLPDCVVFGVDKDGVVERELRESLHLTSPERPVFAVADSFNRVVTVSQGYTIGLGERLLDTLRRLSD